jgi:hypothetical protein
VDIHLSPGGSLRFPLLANWRPRERGLPCHCRAVRASRPGWAVAGVKSQAPPAVRPRRPLRVPSRPLGPLYCALSAEAATRPGALRLAALWACRVALADKFSDDELGSYEAGPGDQARHRWQRGFDRCAAR